MMSGHKKTAGEQPAARNRSSFCRAERWLEDSRLLTLRQAQDLYLQGIGLKRADLRAHIPDYVRNILLATDENCTFEQFLERNRIKIADEVFR